MDETKDKIEMDQWCVPVNSSYAQASKRESQNNVYESLTDVKIRQDELMKHLPSISDMLKVKKWLTILSLLLGTFLVVSVAAAIIASLAYTKTATQIQSDTSGEIKTIQSGQGVNYTALANVASTELHRILNESSVAKDILNRMFMSNFSSLAKKMYGLRMNLTSHSEQLDDVEMKTDGLNDTLSSLGNDLDDLSQSLQDVVNNLASSINLYQNCRRDVESCTISPTFVANVGSEDNKPFCYTSYLSIDVSGFQTMDMRCEYNRDRIYWAIESTSLQRKPGNSNDVRCKCDISDPNPDGNGPVSLPFTIVCDLIIFRCPMSQRIF